MPRRNSSVCWYGRRASMGPDTQRKDPGSARDSRATRPARHVPWCSTKEAWWWKTSLPCHLASSRDPLAVMRRKKLGLSAASRDTTSGSAKSYMVSTERSDTGRQHTLWISWALLLHACPTPLSPPASACRLPLCAHLCGTVDS